MRSIVRVAAVTIALAVVLVSAGCSTPQPEASVEPKVAPPAIANAGVLQVGVDLEYPPFAGTDKGREAGIDIDVATALAERLGLTVKLVQVVPADAAQALADGEADVVLSVPLSEDSVMDATIAGTYIADGPGFFTAGESTDTVTVSSLAGRSIGVQEGSPAFWNLQYQLGNGGTQTYPTLREAFQALVDGDVEVVAGDAIVGAYLARDFEGVRFAGQLDTATPLGVAVAQANTDLEDAIRTGLDALAADGALDAIRSAWVGDLPALDTGGGAASQ